MNGMKPALKRLGLTLTVVLAAAAVPSPASAYATVASISGAQLQVGAGGSEYNDITVSPDGSTYRVIESGSGVTLNAGAGCALDVPNQVVEATIGWMVLFHDPDGLEFHLYSRDRGDLDNSGRPGFGRPAG